MVIKLGRSFYLLNDSDFGSSDPRQNERLELFKNFLDELRNKTITFDKDYFSEIVERIFNLEIQFLCDEYNYHEV